ncbi:helix-turn-helix domain-containing protein [Bradyrhizobium sp. CCBAU 11434]|uniref:helix-turn-helix domain-containing protein n=1 Tax=Bradyrhizobium sp. CCBAU 11434 TaxID=1630885 RepID=UPI00230566F5|nr:helix-turn-helix transcriptional regulator [Bradyrhizobium sp. CCBAU 11434]
MGDIGHQFASYAHVRGWSQDELAYEARISRSYMSKLEKGAYYVSIKMIGRLADKLNVEPAELLNGIQRESAKLDPSQYRSLLSIHSFWLS